ncbi:MAG: hypothetical protein IKJ82_06025 [Oscillospiraceae bacterium]|nr:hypothetical protein [Oscillospiraceae bacterium]
MKKRVLFGLALGIAAASAVAVAVSKISNEMKNKIIEEEFDSPFGNNWVKVSFGSSESAKGLVCIKIKAETDSNEDVCKLVMLAKRDAALSYKWEDNEHFKLYAGKGKLKQCCDVVFDIDKITARYYMVKS